MGLTSRTGLTASPTKKICRQPKLATVQLRAFARPAPFILKPFAGLYNPYPYGCSLLCNHPTDTDAKEILKKAKDNWASEGKNVLLAEEIDAIRAGLDQVQVNDTNKLAPPVESVPEELFRKYTETDSRPVTPAPTLASAATRASGSRRCFTPDPVHTNEVREKTLLILDLRRSHSQETLSWYGGGSSSLQQEPPIIRIQRVATRQGSFESISPVGKSKSLIHLLTHVPRSITPTPVAPKHGGRKKGKEVVDENTPVAAPKESGVDEEEDDDEFIKRRGKKRRKKREGSRGPPPFQTSIDPETQVGTIGPDSHNPSARPSLVPTGSDEIEVLTVENNPKTERKQSRKIDVDSFLNEEILKQLRRELNEEVVDNEFNLKRRKALEEALKTIEKDKIKCDALVELQNELKLPPLNSDLWLALPRTFTRSSAQFELPMDSRELTKMTPLQYANQHIFISSPRKLLYNCIFNKFKMENDMDDNFRRIKGSDVQSALNLMMGKPMKIHQENYFRELMGWKNDDLMDFKTFCGLCAVCERILAPEYCPQLPNRKINPCHEIETADFQALDRKLYGKNVDEKLVQLLNSIKTL